MSKEIIYLVGQISANVKETYTWRQGVVDFFRNENFEIINPCGNNFNKSIAKINMDINNVYSSGGINIIPHKDYTYVKRSTMAFANLNIYDKEKPILGSFFELAWYYTMPEKTVIGIFDGDPNEAIQCKHPFVQEAVTTWVKTPEEACYLTLHYFS